MEKRVFALSTKQTTTTALFTLLPPKHPRYCAMNPDLAHAACTVPEEAYDDDAAAAAAAAVAAGTAVVAPQAAAAAWAVQEAQAAAWQAAAAAMPPPPPSSLYPKRVSDAVSRLLLAGGAWDAAGKGRGRPTPPAWAWDALGTEAGGELTAVAADAADVASAAGYFDAPAVATRAKDVAAMAALAVAAAAAGAVLGCRR